MIFRAGSLIANMILGILLLNKKYSLTKYISVYRRVVVLLHGGHIHAHICTLHVSPNGHLPRSDLCRARETPQGGALLFPLPPTAGIHTPGFQYPTALPGGSQLSATGAGRLPGPIDAGAPGTEHIDPIHLHQRSFHPYYRVPVADGDTGADPKEVLLTALLDMVLSELLHTLPLGGHCHGICRDPLLHAYQRRTNKVKDKLRFCR